MSNTKYHQTWQNNLKEREEQRGANKEVMQLQKQDIMPTISQCLQKGVVYQHTVKPAHNGQIRSQTKSTVRP